MERKNDSTILLLVAAGLGIYWYINSKKKPTDNISTQPVKPQPVTEMPSGTSVPVINNDLSNNTYQNLETTVEPVMQQVTPVTDMFNTVMMTNYVEKTPMDAVYNMNIAPLE
jgi:hypothetical protein